MAATIVTKGPTPAEGCLVEGPHSAHWMPDGMLGERTIETLCPGRDPVITPGETTCWDCDEERLAVAVAICAKRTPMSAIPMCQVCLNAHVGVIRSMDTRNDHERWGQR